MSSLFAVFVKKRIDSLMDCGCFKLDIDEVALSWWIGGFGA